MLGGRGGRELHEDWIDETPMVNTWATIINSYWPLCLADGLCRAQSWDM